MPSRLNIDPNFQHPDDFYEILIEAHKDLDPADIQAFHARLILLLSNHIGDQAVLREAISAARGDLATPQDGHSD